MSDNITPAQQQTIRIAYENIETVINALQLAENHKGTDENAAAAILLCRRQLAKSIDSLSDAFGANWLENK